MNDYPDPEFILPTAKEGAKCYGGCVHWVEGACLAEERIGRSESFLCQVLVDRTFAAIFAARKKARREQGFAK